MGGSLANSWPDEALCCPSDDIRTLERPLIGQQQPLIGQIDPIKSRPEKNLAEWRWALLSH